MIHPLPTVPCIATFFNSTTPTDGDAFELMDGNSRTVRLLSNIKDSHFTLNTWRFLHARLAKQNAGSLKWAISSDTYSSALMATLWCKLTEINREESEDVALF